MRDYHLERLTIIYLCCWLLTNIWLHSSSSVASIWKWCKTRVYHTLRRLSPISSYKIIIRHRSSRTGYWDAQSPTIPDDVSWKRTTSIVTTYCISILTHPTIRIQNVSCFLPLDRFRFHNLEIFGREVWVLSQYVLSSSRFGVLHSPRSSFCTSC